MKLQVLSLKSSSLKYARSTLCVYISLMHDLPRDFEKNKFRELSASFWIYFIQFLVCEALADSLTLMLLSIKEGFKFSGTLFLLILQRFNYLRSIFEAKLLIGISSFSSSNLFPCFDSKSRIIRILQGY